MYALDLCVTCVCDLCVFVCVNIVCGCPPCTRFHLPGYVTHGTYFKATEGAPALAADGASWSSSGVVSGELQVGVTGPDCSMAGRLNFSRMQLMERHVGCIWTR